MGNGRILVVDDEAGIRSFFHEVLVDAGHSVVQAESGDEAVLRLEESPFDLMLLDLRMPGALGGMDVLRRARASWPDLQIVVLTAHGTVGQAVEAMRMGAFDFLEKPVEGPAALRRLVTRALNWRGSDNSQVKRAVFAPDAAPERRDLWGRVKRVLWQLKRRHVYNVAATYAAIGFMILQLAEVAVPALPVPAWSYALVAGIVLSGFPVALALGWIYDITSSGITRTIATD